MSEGVVSADFWLHQFAGTNAESKIETRALLGGEVAGLTPKPVKLLRRLIEMTCDPSGLVLDFFAGSGTTGNAVVDLNRQSLGHRKFILVEMGDYFDTVLLPRIKKVTFTPEWKDSKPKRVATSRRSRAQPAPREGRPSRILRRRAQQPGGPPNRQAAASTRRLRGAGRGRPQRAIHPALHA